MPTNIIACHLKFNTPYDKLPNNKKEARYKKSGMISIAKVDSFNRPISQEYFNRMVDNNAYISTFSFDQSVIILYRDSYVSRSN
jgi:hypothetical protein